MQIPTNAQLAEAVGHINSLAPRPDVVIASGDLVDHGREEEYEVLREILAPLAMPVFVIPGNHDRRDALLKVSADRPYLPRAGSPFVHYAIDDYTFEKMLGERGTVDREERTLRARTPSMDLVRKNVLAGAALAGEKNRRVAGGCAFRLLQQALRHGIVRFEQGNEIVSRARYRTSQSFVFFVHRRPLIQKSIPALKPDHVDAKTPGAADQIGTNRAPK